MPMAALIATCFSLSLLLGNICPMQLAAFTASHPPAETEVMAMTPAHEEPAACSRTMEKQQSSGISFPYENTCSSGHCLAKGDQTAWLQVALPSPLPVAAPIVASPSPLATRVPVPHFRFASSPDPPLSPLHHIVLRI